MREPKKRRSILEFGGMDQESWEDVDIREYLNGERDSWNSVKSQACHKARDFRGVGRETWKDVDVEEYVRQERASWDG